MARSRFGTHPDQIQLQSPFGDANAGAPGENMPGQASEQRMASAIAPSDRAHDRNPEGLPACNG
jgi:hypothetical protein